MRNIEAQEQYKRTTASTDNYVKTDLGIKHTDDETKNVISSTFGLIKNNLEALWYSVGLEPNVNIAYEKTMSDPNQCINVNGKNFYPHPGVGNLKAYNEMGNPAGGCFSMQTLA
ncbi:MAG: hypothetical protein K2F57_02255 [Candidatus Gastranaerophilales bacterium]|nr:hypothetical protein [Candidatus Gastranaerophilales bacterium]